MDFYGVLFVIAIPIWVICTYAVVDPIGCQNNLVKWIVGIRKLKERLGKPTIPTSLTDCSNSYNNYRVEYEDFASILLECLCNIGGKLGLAIPDVAKKLYAAELADRVRLDNGCITFLYELKPEESSFKEIMSGKQKRAPRQVIEDTFRNNLKGYLYGGYGYSTILIATPDTRTRVEVRGVYCNRQVPVGGITI